jgi:isoleucyl-tRNA synthetase
MTSSVHLADFPDVSNFPEAPKLIADMDRVRDACNAGLSVRSQVNIRTRQPLAKLTLYGAGAERLKQFSALIADELNVKEVAFADDLGQVAEHKLKLHNQILGKRLPAKMKQIIPAAKKGEWELLDNGNVKIEGEELFGPEAFKETGGKPFKLENGDMFDIQAEEFTLELQPKPGIEGAAALSTNDALVVLDLEITPELELEGLARDFVRMVQEARKMADLNVTDRIELQVEATGKAAAAIEGECNRLYIMGQVLATALTLQPVQATHRFEQELDGEKITFGFEVTGA